MNNSVQSILIRRKSKVYIPKNTVDLQTSKEVVGAVIANFGSLGYVMSADLVNVLLTLGNAKVENFYQEFYPILKEQVGAYGYKPMYPNFPSQVANASDAELYINAIIHYFGDAVGQRIMPEYEEEVRFPFCEDVEPRFLGVTQEYIDLGVCIKEILESKSSPSVQDKLDIDTFFANGIAPEASISNKETLAYVCALDVTYWHHIKTATDVLRVAVAMSKGDISLTKPSKFRTFTRSERRMFLNTLDKMHQNSVAEDMVRFKGMWIRLGEKLHPNEYKSKYPYICESFDKLRNGKIQTTNSKIEANLANENWDELLTILKSRPGDFARRLNAVLSKCSNKMAVIASFKEVIGKVSTPVLCQLYGYYTGYNNLKSFRNRLFLPKTPLALVSENNLPDIATTYRTGVIQVIYNALTERFSSFPELGKVYIDPVCNGLLIPTGNRSASNALRQAGRGSRFALNKDKSTVRCFVYWKDDEDGRSVDLDLSAVMYDKDFNFIGHCSWTNLSYGKGDGAAMVHSGDITSAPEGASEFLDINLNKLGKNVAYIATSIHCYTGQKMNKLNVGFMGWMERERPDSGEIFEPKSVVGRCDLTADAVSTTPCIIDVHNREIVWTDLPMVLSGSANSVHNTVNKGIATAELATRMIKTRMTLEELFMIHVIARKGEIVENKEDADFTICEGGNLSPYDIAKITAEYL